MVRYDWFQALAMALSSFIADEQHPRRHVAVVSTRDRVPRRRSARDKLHGISGIKVRATETSLDLAKVLLG